MRDVEDAYRMPPCTPCAPTGPALVLVRTGISLTELRQKTKQKNAPGCPYFNTGDTNALATTPLGNLASPEGPTSMIGATPGTTVVVAERDGPDGGNSGLLRRADTTVASPPPTTAPTAKQAVCMAAALGILRLWVCSQCFWA